MKNILSFGLKHYKMIIIVVLFLMGLLFCCTCKTSDLLENFDLMSDCPNMLIRKGKELHLINTKKTIIPGVNPVKFNNLEEYAEFVDWQKTTGVNCPILYFQESYDSQNKKSLMGLNEWAKCKLPNQIKKNK